MMKRHRRLADAAANGAEPEDAYDPIKAAMEAKGERLGERGGPTALLYHRTAGAAAVGLLSRKTC